MSEDPILVHLEYIRKDIERVENAILASTSELKRENDAQWTDIKDNSRKIANQAGKNGVISMIVSAISTTVLHMLLKK